MTAYPETTLVVQDIVLEQYEDELAPPCDYCADRGRSAPARWIMHKDACCKDLSPVGLACDGCKDVRMAQEGVLICPWCEFVFHPPCSAYRYIEPLVRRA